MNKLSFRMVIVLVSISTLSGLILSFTWNVSKEKIAQNAKMNIQKAIYEIQPQATNFEIKNIKGQDIYFIKKDKELIGKFFLANGNGFQGNISVAVTVSPQVTKIIGIRILEQLETPGLGSKITEDNFLGNFINLSLAKTISVDKISADKANSQIKAITGATISSRAVTTIINNKMAMLKSVLQGE